MSEEKQEKLEGYELSEEQLIEMLRYLEEKRKLLLKHPESPDYVAIWTLEEHILRRLNKIAWEKYRKEQGIEI